MNTSNVTLIRRFDSIKTVDNSYLVILRKKPLKGEVFISGAVAGAYRAPKDMTNYQWVVTNPEVISSKIL